MESLPGGIKNGEIPRSFSLVSCLEGEVRKMKFVGVHARNRRKKWSEGGYLHRKRRSQKEDSSCPVKKKKKKKKKKNGKKASR